MLRGMYRLNDFLGTTSFKSNLPPILAVVYFLVIVLAAAKLYKKYGKGKIEVLNERLLEQVMVGVRTALLLIMQEAILLIYVAIRFSDLNGGFIFMIILYCIATIFTIVDCNINPLPFFRSLEIMNLCFVKRLILPALVVLPYQFSYSLLVFLVGFSFIDLLMLTKATKVKTKNYIYLIAELACIGLLGGFAISDLANNNSTQASAVSIFSTLMLAAYTIIFIVEIVFGFRKTLKKNKVGN